LARVLHGSCPRQKPRYCQSAIWDVAAAPSPKAPPPRAARPKCASSMATAMPTTCAPNP
jgi:hypothetical protein